MCRRETNERRTSDQCKLLHPRYLATRVKDLWGNSGKVGSPWRLNHDGNAWIVLIRCPGTGKWGSLRSITLLEEVGLISSSEISVAATEDTCGPRQVTASQKHRHMRKEKLQRKTQPWGAEGSDKITRSLGNRITSKPRAPRGSWVTLSSVGFPCHLRASQAPPLPSTGAELRWQPGFLQVLPRKTLQG